MSLKACGKLSVFCVYKEKINAYSQIQQKTKGRPALERVSNHMPHSVSVNSGSRRHITCFRQSTLAHSALLAYSNSVRLTSLALRSSYVLSAYFLLYICALVIFPDCSRSLLNICQLYWLSIFEQLESF